MFAFWALRPAKPNTFLFFMKPVGYQPGETAEHQPCYKNENINHFNYQLISNQPISHC
jgi:hypothetical protein